MAAVSRRGFLLGVGTGVASASLVWGASKLGLWPRHAADLYPLPQCCAYVEYAGWILTKPDKDRLTSSGSLRVLDGMSLNGKALEDNTVDNLDACSSWCLSEPECQGFTFGKPTHPDIHLQRRCYLKAGGDLSPVPDSRFASGLR